MPSTQDYADLDRRQAYVAWLTANGINARDVMRDADVVIEDGPDGRHIRIEVCDLGPDGRRQLDERLDKVAVKTITVPLLVEPPEWWQPYEKPTRDQLLDVVERLRALAPDLEMEATLPGLHDAAREAKRDASRRMRDILGKVSG